jgi:hypothetical protein
MDSDYFWLYMILFSLYFSSFQSFYHQLSYLELRHYENSKEGDSRIIMLTSKVDPELLQAPGPRPTLQSVLMIPGWPPWWQPMGVREVSSWESAVPGDNPCPMGGGAHFRAGWGPGLGTKFVKQQPGERCSLISQPLPLKRGPRPQSKPLPKGWQVLACEYRREAKSSLASSSGIKWRFMERHSGL